MESREIEVPSMADRAWQEGEISGDIHVSALTEAALHALIEQWRKGDSDAAKRVWSYIYVTYYPWVLDKVAKRVRIELPASEANSNDEDLTGVDETESCKEDDGDVSEPVGVGHGTQGPCDAKVCKAPGSFSGYGNTQHHDYVGEGGLKTFEDLDLALSRRVCVTQNNQPGTHRDAYTGNYTGRCELGSRKDFEWKGKPAFGKFVKDMWVNRSIDSFRRMTDYQPTGGPRLIEGDVPDVQGLQEAVFSGIRPIDLFLRRQLDGVCKEGELLSETVLLAMLNHLIDGEPLWCQPEIGFVDFGTGFKPKTKASQRRANRAMLVDQYPGLIVSVEERVPGAKKWVFAVQVPGYRRLIHDGKERTAGMKGVPPAEAKELMEEDALVASAAPAVGDRQIQSRDPLTVGEAAGWISVAQKLVHEIFRLSELKESLRQGATDRRLLEGLIIFRKHMLWNTSHARPALAWTSGTALTEEQRTLFDEIRRTPIEQLMKEADLSVFLDDPCEARQPLYVQARKLILQYSMLDLPVDMSKADMEKRANSFVHQPKRRLRRKLEPIVPWFYRDKDKKDEEAAS